MKNNFTWPIIIALAVVLIAVGYLVYESITDSHETPSDLNQENLIGGQKDSHGCLGPAGYSWNSTLGVCLREWELKTDDERKAVKIAIVPLSFPVTIVSVESTTPENFVVNYQRNDNQELIKVQIINWSIDDSNKVYCTPNQRGENIVCTMDYNPVCGFFNQSIKCFKYPCANTYSNGCTACVDSKVEYYVSNECPK